MNRLAHWMMRLYPARWRRRYGDELDALLTDTGADARIVSDLFRGGVRMQFRTWSFLKLAITLGLAGLVVGAALTWFLPAEYTSTATLQITPAKVREGSAQATVHNFLNDYIQMAETIIMSRTELSGIINDPRLLLYRGELKTKPLEDVIEEMKQQIHINFVTLPGPLAQRATGFEIKFTYPDPVKAQRTVRILVDRFMEQNLAGQTARRVAEARTELLDAPNLPESPVYPGRPVALLGGFLLGVFAASVWRITQRTGFIVRRFALVAVVIGIACAPAYFLAHALRLVPYQYRSTATIRLRNTPQEIFQLKNEVLSRTSLSMVVNDPRLHLYANQLKTVPLEDVLRNMKAHLKITQYNDRDGARLTIEFAYPDNYKAQQTVEAIVSRFDEISQHWYKDAAPLSGVAPMIMDVLDAPSLPKVPSYPNRRRIAAVGGYCGVFLAGVISLIRRLWNPEPDFPIDVVEG